MLNEVIRQFLLSLDILLFYTRGFGQFLTRKINFYYKFSNNVNSM